MYAGVVLQWAHHTSSLVGRFAKQNHGSIDEELEEYYPKRHVLLIDFIDWSPPDEEVEGGG